MKMYQLHIEKEIVEDWIGTIYHSRLYHSVDECVAGCVEDEIYEIAHALLENGDFPDNTTPGVCCEDADHLKTLYEDNDEGALRFVDSVRKWFFSEIESLCNDSSLSWRVLMFDVVPKNETHSNN